MGVSTQRAGCGRIGNRPICDRFSPGPVHLPGAGPDWIQVQLVSGVVNLSAGAAPAPGCQLIKGGGCSPSSGGVTLVILMHFAFLDCKNSSSQGLLAPPARVLRRRAVERQAAVLPACPGRCWLPCAPP